MDGQDPKNTITPAVHEVHGVHLCHRCGWPFPNLHPSAKHRRAHKRVCGTVEGYRVSPSDLVISDDDDEDEQLTPSPKDVKSNVKESSSDGEVHLRSNKSEDDVFSDAATEFSEIGISPGLQDRLEVFKGGDDKKLEQKSMEGDINVNLLKKVDESAEITEKLSDPISSDQTSSGTEAVSVEPGSHKQSDDTKYETPKSVPLQVEGDKLASVSFNSKEEKASDPVLVAFERKEEPHDKLDGSTHVSDTTMCPGAGAVFAEPDNHLQSDDTKYESPKSVPLQVEGDKLASLSFNSKEEKASYPELMAFVRKEEPHDKLPHDKLDGSTHVSDTTTFTAVEDKPEMEDVEVPLAGKSDTFVPSETSGDHVGSSNDKSSVTTVSNLVSHNYTLPEDDSTTSVLEQNANQHDETANSELPVAGNESGKGDSVEEQVILKSSKRSLDSTDPLPSGEVDVDPRQLESLSKTDSGLLEFKDVDFMRSRQGFEAGNITGLDMGLNDIPDVVENYTTNNSFTNDVQKPSESSDVVHKDTEQKHDSGPVILAESSDSSPLKVPETTSGKEKCLLETDSDKSNAIEGFNMPASVGIVETPDKISLEDPSNANKKVSAGEKAAVSSKSLQDEGNANDNLINEKDSISAADSLEGKWGSISAVETNSQSSPRSETNMKNSERRNIKGHQSKSDDFEPPSFMTLVQPGKTSDPVAAPTASEIEPVQYNQQQNSELQAGWFPSLTNVVNDSQGRKKNEEIIAKVTNWNSGKEHHDQLKNLLNEAKSPTTKQQKDETFQKDDGAAGTTVSSVETEEPKVEIPHNEDWNSPARYPTMIKKEKKKGKPYWVPFVCCSSVHRDL